MSLSTAPPTLDEFLKNAFAYRDGKYYYDDRDSKYKSQNVSTFNRSSGWHREFEGIIKFSEHYEKYVAGKECFIIADEYKTFDLYFEKDGIGHCISISTVRILRYFEEKFGFNYIYCPEPIEILDPINSRFEIIDL